MGRSALRETRPGNSSSARKEPCREAGGSNDGLDSYADRVAAPTRPTDAAKDDPVYELANLKRQQIADVAPDTVAVLPIGSLEQHGEHLPLGTDTMLVDTVAGRAFHDRDDVVLCPTLPYGFSGHHQFACALSISPNTLLTVLSELLKSLVKAGFHRILVLNGHGGNIETMNQAIKLAALEQPILAACCSYWELDAPSSATPGHAGKFETDLMSAARPELVGPGGTGPSEPPLFARTFVPGLRIERHGEWPRAGGVTDPPGDGDLTRGETIIAASAAALQGCIDALRATSLPSETSLTMPPPPTAEDSQ